MNFNDDEPIVANSDVSGAKPVKTFPAGKTKASLFHKPEAPLEETKFKVMLELTGQGSAIDRSGVDLVTVLDISGSMEGHKLAKLKMAMLFLIKKLSPIDRLSVVTFANESRRLCPLRQITEKSQDDIGKQVNDLVAKGGTNITAGLQMALQVLKGRLLSSGRVVAIMLLSDGQQNVGDAAQVPLDVPVYTFGFGADHDPKVLNAIAVNSKGGTFSVVKKEDNLSMVFSQCLAGLLTVVVQDLTLTLGPLDDSTILNVSAGDYPKSNDNGSVTVSFGDLYEKERRKVIVDLLLPTVTSPQGADILRVTYKYSTGSTGGKPFRANPIRATINRTNRVSVQAETPEVKDEETRLRTAGMINEARVLADNNKLEDAKDKIVEAQNSLEDEADVDTNPLISMLKYELIQLLRFMKSQEIYEKQGRPFALSSETSHHRQRFAARGDDLENMRLFATPRMDDYLEQAKQFDEDPTKPLPSVDEDVQKEVAADPLAPIAGAISYYIQTAIDALKSIDSILNATRA